jgi:hypothetical protein
MNNSASDKEANDKARQLRELFRGRFNQETALKLVQELGGLDQAVDFIFNEDPEQVSTFIKQSSGYLESLRADSAKLASILTNKIEDSVRQFVCGDCKRSWWKRVPLRKEVSRCTRCRVKYEPIPREHESGLGKFLCPCGNEFTGFACMGETLSECYTCGAKVPVDCMIPPRRNRERKSKAPHSCNGFNCYNINHRHGHDDNFSLDNYQLPYQTPVVVGNYSHSSLDYGQRRIQNPEPPVCIHPKSSKGRRRIRHTSKRHVSTGSTVSTFLSQRSLDIQSVSVMSDLYSIDE